MGIKGKFKIIIGVLALFISFFSFLIYKNKDNKEQAKILEHLIKQGVSHRFEYAEWTDFLPVTYRKFFGYSIEIEVLSDSLLKMGNEEPQIDSEFMLKLSKLKNVTKVIYYGRDSFIRNRSIEKIGEHVFKLISEYSKLKSLELELDFLSERHIEKLRQIKSLESLSITSEEVPENLLLKISDLTNLKNLKIDTYTNFNQENIQSLKSLQDLELLFLGKYFYDRENSKFGYFNFYKVDKYLPHLKNLKYLGTSIDFGKFDFSKFPKLVWYRDSKINVDSQTFERLVKNHKNKTEKVKELKELMEYSRAGLELKYDIKSDDLKYLNELTFLEAISFQNPDLNFGEIHWEKFTSLTSLEFPLGISLVDLLPHLKKLRSLEYLKGAGKDFTFEHFSEIRKTNPGLDSFYLIDARKDEKKYDKNSVKFRTDFLGEEFYSADELKSFDDKSLPYIKLKLDKLNSEIVRELGHFTELQDLKIECNEGLELLNLLRTKDQLDRLDVTFKVEPKQALNNFTKLKQLHCNYEYETSRLDKLIDAKTFPELKEIYIENPLDIPLRIDSLQDLVSLEKVALNLGDQIVKNKISLKNVKYFSTNYKCSIENIEFSSKLEIFDFAGFTPTSSEQVKCLYNHAHIVEHLNLSYLLDPENIDINDLSKFKNLNVLRLPPKSISKAEIKELANSLPKLNQLHIRNTGLRRGDIPEKEDLHISYE